MQGNGIDRSENIRLKMGVPFLRLSRYEIDPQVARLVPEELCRRHRLIPILRNPEHIIVAMADPIEEAALKLVERQVGVPVRAVVGTESEIKEAIDRFFGPDRGIAEPSKRWWADFFLESQLLTRDQLDQAIAIQKETGKPFEKVLYGLSLIPEKTLLNVLSIHYKVPYLDLSQVDIPSALAEALPEHLAYHHGVVPVSLEGKTLTLAVDSPPPMATLDEIGLASGRNLKFVLSSPSQIQTSLVRLYSKAQGIPEEEVLSYLLQESYINQVHLAEARGWAEKSKERVLGTLIQLGHLSQEDLDQVLSLKFGFPIIDLDLFPVDRRALDLVSPAVAQGLVLLPIALGPNELIVAMDDPTRTDVTRDLRSVLGRNVRVVVAEESAIVEGLARYYQEPGQVAPSPPTARPEEEVGLPETERVSPEREAIPSDQVAPVAAEPSRPRSNLFSWVAGKGLSTNIGFLSYLAEKGLLSEEEALELLNRHINFQASLLTLLVEEGRMSAKEFAHRASDFSGMMYYDLTPFRNDEGRTVDPVDHEIAVSFPQEAAVGLKVLPLGELNGSVLLAVADPMDFLSLYLAQKLIRRDVVPVVAPVDQILQALGRIFPEEIREVEPEEERRVKLHLILGEEKLARFERLGELLRSKNMITEKQLEAALEYQREKGGRLGEVILALGYLNYDDLFQAISEQLDVPEIDLSKTPVYDRFVRMIPEILAREEFIIPIGEQDGKIEVVMADPLNIEAVRKVESHTGKKAIPYLAPPREIFNVLERVYRSQYVKTSVEELYYRSPDESAYHTLSTRQKIVALGFVLLSVALLYYNYLWYFIVLNAFATLFYLSFSFYKFFLMYKALAHDLEIPVTEEELRKIDERKLPIYTILVPLYREAEVLSKLVRAIDELDWPKVKLDVKLLLEEDDEETLEAVRNLKLPPHFNVVVVPDSLPKTKPKACNYGLIHARGKYTVIYDAEDLPEPDQLKKIYVAYSKAIPQIVCIQSKLNYYNRTQNLLTRWFTTEYSMWFDLFMPGLDASNAPIPLGGTSNHFITAKLRELGAWDPFNVTEDADLGIRMHARGYKTTIIDSTTFEEANSEIYNWIRQISRWVKGYMQTWLVHMRHPMRLYRKVGFKSFFSFQMVIAGTFFGFLMNPVYWTLTALWFLTEWGFIQSIFPSVIYYIGAIALYIGNFLFTYVNVAGTMRRKYYDTVKYALLSPLYWALMSYAAWKALIQLVYKPHFWEKTQHGLYQGGEPLDQIPLV